MLSKNLNWSRMVILVIVVLLVSVTIASMKKMRAERESFYINNNLKLIVAAGKRYMADYAVTRVGFSELRDLYLEEIDSVAGESYHNLQVEATGFFSLNTQDGRTIEYAY